MKRGVLPVIALVFALGIAGTAQAATFSVTRADDPAAGTCDPGDCSLREAVLAANTAAGDDTVALPALTVSVTLGEIPLTANGRVTVLGQGAAVSVIDGGNLSRVFQGGISSDLEVDSLTIRDGSATGSGGAIQLFTESTVTARNSRFSSNEATGTGGAIQINGSAGAAATIVDSSFDGNSSASNGGAIQINTPATLTVSRSFFFNNTGTSAGGAIKTNSDVITTISDSTFVGNRAVSTSPRGGALQIDTGANAFTVTNSTFTGNRAEHSGVGSGRGGAIQINGGKLSDLNNVTIAGNTATGAASAGGGLETGVPAAVTLRNSIIADNVAATATNCAGPYISGGFNLESANTCSLGASDLINSSPGLGPLTDNGGPMVTMALASTSVALDAGNPAAGTCATADQRGVPRPQGGRCDIGAYELARCRGVLVNRIGTAGADALLGTTGADGFLLLGGNDTADGGKGKDGICGNTGNDVLRGGPAADRLSGGAGRDRLLGQGGADNLSGGGRKDRCVGGKGKDKAKGCERRKAIP